MKRKTVKRAASLPRWLQAPALVGEFLCAVTVRPPAEAELRGFLQRAAGATRPQVRVALRAISECSETWWSALRRGLGEPVVKSLKTTKKGAAK